MITLKQNDTGIGLRATLSNQNGAVDLTDASVLFLCRDHQIKAKIEDAEKGVVSVVFNQIHTSKPGIFNAEFEVKFKDGRIETFPNDGYVKLNIIRDLGGKS